MLIDAGGYRDQDWDLVQKLVSVQDIAGVERLYQALFVRAPSILRHSKGAFLAAYTSPGVKSILSGTEERDAYTDADLATIGVPAALLWGERDGLFPLATARAMRVALPRASLTVIPSCGHAVHLGVPGAPGSGNPGISPRHPALRWLRISSSTLKRGRKSWRLPSMWSASIAKPPATVFEWVGEKLIEIVCPACGNEDPEQFILPEDLEEMMESG